MLTIEELLQAWEHGHAFIPKPFDIFSENILPPPYFKASDKSDWPEFNYHEFLRFSKNY